MNIFESSQQADIEFLKLENETLKKLNDRFIDELQVKNDTIFELREEILRLNELNVSKINHFIFDKLLSEQRNNSK